MASSSPPPTAAHNAALALLLVALKTLSQKTILAMAALRRWLFRLLTAGSVFWLWLSIPEPSPHQLVGLGMYAVFIIVVNGIEARTP